VGDIFAFLAAWFAGNPNSDVQNLGPGQVNNIFAFLGMWFAGC
jgi:hypothetical protein